MAEEAHPTIQQYGPADVRFHGSSLSSRHKVFHAPVVRQWIHRGKIHREHVERVPSRLELFFDLVFVAIAHQLSQAAAENASGAGLLKFVLTFYPTWALWGEFRNFVNASGTDDILQRFVLLWMMALLVGYTANASSIKLGSPEVHEATQSVAHVVLSRALDTAVAEVASKAVKDPALVAATAFFLVGKATRMGFLIWYALALPLFRPAFLLQALYQSINFVIYFPLLFVHEPRVIIALASAGLATDIVLRYGVGIPILVARRRTRVHEQDSEKAAEDTGLHPLKANSTPCAYERTREDIAPFIPATNIEHFVERTAAFVVIVLGDMVLSVVYHASASQVGLTRIYGSAVSGLVIAFNLCWLYFDAECSFTFVHAMRRHWFTSLTFTNLHFPLCSSLILVSAAMSRITQHEEEVTPGVRWFFCGGLGVALISMALIGVTHRGLDPAGQSRIGRVTQLGLRLVVGVAILCLPLAKHMSPLNLSGACAGLTGFLVVEETFGKMRRGEALAKPNAGETGEESSEPDKGDAELEVEKGM